jgi:hypothetical protein
MISGTRFSPAAVGRARTSAQRDGDRGDELTEKSDGDPGTGLIASQG